MTRDKQFYKSFFSICIVLMLQNIITISVNLMDNIMLGSFSEVALSGAAAVNNIQFIFQQVLTAAGEGLVIFGSQYWGKHDLKPIRKTIAVALRTGWGVGIVLFVAMSLFPHQIIGLFTTNEEIIAEGVAYLGIIRFTYLFFATTIILLSALRSVEIVKISLYLSIMTLVVNCSINYVLIYGRFGAPKLGIQGAAIGTLVARILEFLVVLYYVYHREYDVKFRFSDCAHRDPLIAGDYFKITVSMMFVQGLWGLNTAVQTAVLGHISDSAIAANSVSSTLYMLLKSMAVGAASAAAVIIGKTIGKDEFNKLKEYSKTMQILFLLIGAVSGTLLFFLRVPVLGLYNLSSEAHRLANTFLIIQCVVCFGMSYQMAVNNGIIRGGGSAQFIVKLDLISIWCIVIPLSLFMAFVVKASPVVVFICLNADQIFKCVPAFLKVNYGTWAKKLTR